MYDVRNLKPWVYARSSSPHPEVLIRQMKGLLTDAEQNGWQIVGTSQDMSTGRTLARMGLREAQRAIRQQQANALLVENVGKISHDYSTALHVLEFLQDHGAVLLCTQSDVRYELHIKDLSQILHQRAARKRLGLPWWTGGESFAKGC
jgi:DNA invertase Pin-like site-specific DNA recombinase